MGLEAALWTRLRRTDLCVRGKWLRVENPACPGTPDVHYCVDGISGWLELKRLESWPVRAGTPVRIEHYTKEQRLWIMDYALNGGRVHLLLQVASDFLLFDPSAAVDVVGYGTRERLVESACVHGHPRAPIEALRARLLG
jgi:hypothetical protein